MTTPAQTERTERTPLLQYNLHQDQLSTETTESPTRLSPPILPHLAQFKTGLPLGDSWCPNVFTTEGGRTAFVLLVWLHYARLLQQRTQSVDDIWEEWDTEVRDSTALRNVERRITETWATFLDAPRTPSEIEEVLWRPFPLRGNEHSPLTRVIDLYVFLPREVITHRVLELSLLRVWRYYLRPTSQTGNAWDSTKRVLWMMFPPRRIHAVDLIGLVAYLAILVRYSLDPPDVAIEEATTKQLFRSGLIVSYGFANFLQDFSWAKVPFLLTATSFLSASPAPSSGDLGYSVILAVLCTHIVQLHISSSPSPIYLYPFAQALPLSTLIWNGFAKIYLPVLLMFLPALLLASVLLSFSLADVVIIPASTAFASPLEARTVFLLLGVVLLLLLICSLGMLVLVYPFISAHSSGSPWDRYSTSVGLDARRSFVRTVLQYASLHSQFNLGSTLSTHSLFYARTLSLISLARRTLWWIAVGPLSFLLVCYLVLDIFT
ncbi:hypothetical protein PHLGIDRAFT_398647 [Phlebiopsis gigantea 11061_1 CR5-6]|uniref:Uncharacterized protein n=1 Tax=Phlebiopsis gigantea (strain 11061_1 CR5-6) TaxID=745531 RepID=A0A0C3SFF9_PHLG1|nr:hypothetical protein PHLGIDRAFT_398647 [Phlebiopsis gigantea 11061_1 CR5-6]